MRGYLGFARSRLTFILDGLIGQRHYTVALVGQKQVKRKFRVIFSITVKLYSNDFKKVLKELVRKNEVLNKFIHSNLLLKNLHPQTLWHKDLKIYNYFALFN